MTDSQITAALTTRSPLPTVYAVISESHCGYEKALRCLNAVILPADEIEILGILNRVAEAQRGEKKVYTLEDF